MLTRQSIHIAMLLWSCIFCVIVGVCILFVKYYDKRNRNVMACIMFGMALLLISDSGAWAFRGNTTYSGFWMVRICNFLVFLMSDVVIMMYHSYVCVNLFGGNYSYEIKTFIKKLPVRAVCGYYVCLTGIALVIISQYTGLYYSFDSSNRYYRCAGYPISLIIPLAAMIIDMSLLIQYRKRITTILMVSMISYIVLPVISAIVLFFYYGISLVNISMTISVLFMFMVSIIEQSKKAAQKEKELYDIRTKMLLSQIGPHFIYNTLSTIKILCKKNPELAAETTDEFARYLRGNIAALDNDRLVGIDNEIRHAECYLSIEQKRFGDRIKYRFNIRDKDVLLPSLTIQPLVENAVKHGLIKKEDGGNIEIKSYNDGHYHIIEIIDDGVGFNVSDIEAIGMEHVGIRNVKSRVMDKCKGELLINSSEGKGTTVTIRIPV